MKNIKTPKAILFDWDNTLVDTWPIIHKAINETLKAFQRPLWSIEETRHNVHRSMRDAFPDLFGSEWEKASEIYFKHFLENHLVKLQVLANAEDVIKFLFDKGVYIAVVSNKTGKHLRTEVNHLGWNNYFKKIVGATDAEADKPSSAPIKLALQGSGLEISEDIWLVGDSVTDLECAKNSGIGAVFYGDEKIPGDYKTLLHIKNHSEFLPILKSIF